MKWLRALFLGSAAVAGGTAQSESVGIANPQPLGGDAANTIEFMPSATPEGIPCKPSADRRRAMALGRALNSGFGVQYWGEGYTADGLEDQPHGLLIIETTKLGAQYSAMGREELFSPHEITQISRQGSRPVLGYLNVSEIEEYRDYWVLARAAEGSTAARPEWFGPLAQHGDRLAAYWLASWREVLFDRVDRLMAAGVDGLFLDDVLHYYTYATGAHANWPGNERPDGPQDAPGLAQAMMALVVAVSDRVREWNCDAFVIVNNGVFIGRDAGGATGIDGSFAEFEAYRAAIDGILVENILSPGAHPSARAALTEDYQSQGLQVLTVDSIDRFSAPSAGTVRESVAEDAFKEGFYPYIVDDAWFSRLSLPVPANPKG